MKIACVYWIHLHSHSDIYSEGYVGVAVDVPTRLNRHLNVTSKLDVHFGRAIRLYGWENLKKEIVFTGHEQECYKYEEKLRPSFQIGWNEAIGGKGGDRSKFINYSARAKPIGNKKSKIGKTNPFYGKSHSEDAKFLNRKSHALSTITTPDGIFYGFTSLAKFLGVHKQTAKKIALKEGWKIESKSKMH